MAQRIDYKNGDILGNCTFLYDTKTVKHPGIMGRSGVSRYGKFKCYCGEEFETIISFIKTGKQKSCGCITKKWKIGRKQHIKHGHSKSDEHSIWLGMKARCRESSKSKENYFDKGVAVCDRWSNNRDGFQNFLQDMKERPSKLHSIDRIDGNKGYFPENCKWATIREQNGNKSSNVMISHKGETKCLQYWADEYNLKRSTLGYRIWKGWDIEKALTTPLYNLERIAT